MSTIIMPTGKNRVPKNREVTLIKDKSILGFTKVGCTCKNSNNMITTKEINILTTVRTVLIDLVIIPMELRVVYLTMRSANFNSMGEKF